MDIAGIHQLESFLTVRLSLAFGQWEPLARGQRVGGFWNIFPSTNSLPGQGLTALFLMIAFFYSLGYPHSSICNSLALSGLEASWGCWPPSISPHILSLYLTSPLEKACPLNSAQPPCVSVPFISLQAWIIYHQNGILSYRCKKWSSIGCTVLEICLLSFILYFIIVQFSYMCRVVSEFLALTPIRNNFTN